MAEVRLLSNSFNIRVIFNEGTFSLSLLSIITCVISCIYGEIPSRWVCLCEQAGLSRRYSGFDLQRELIEGVFIHHQCLIQEELSHLGDRQDFLNCYYATRNP